MTDSSPQERQAVIHVPLSDEYDDEARSELADALRELADQVENHLDFLLGDLLDSTGRHLATMDWEDVDD
jgi:hypothetical protein